MPRHKKDSMSDSKDLPLHSFSVVISKPDGEKTNSILSETVIQGNEAKQRKDLNGPPTSKSSCPPAKSNHSNKTTSEACNASKDKQQTKPRTRVIQSRFRAGLSGSKNNSGSNSKNGSSSNMSNSSSNSLNCTMGGSLSSSNNGSRNKTSSRGALSMKSGFGKSVGNVAKASSGAGRSTTNLTSHARPTKSALTLAETERAGGVRNKLHSTILAERTMLGSTHNLFSTTLVGGMGPGGKKMVASKKFDVTCAALPELPDISAIRLESASSDKSDDITILSTVSEKDSSQESSSGDLQEVTLADLQKEYLRYLQSAYIDAISGDAFDKQLDELKTQLIFLDQLTSEKQCEVSEQKEKLELIHHHQVVYETYTEQTEQLHKLVDSLPASEDALKVLTVELEKNLHQVKMDNLYVPESHKTYRDDLLDALQSQIACLEELTTVVEPRSHQLTSTVNLLDDLQNNSQRIQQYEREVNQAARLAIQEASLLLGAKQVNNECSGTLQEAN